jgi:hypothetical protein
MADTLGAEKCGNNNNTMRTRICIYVISSMEACCLRARNAGRKSSECALLIHMLSYHHQIVTLSSPLAWLVHSTKHSPLLYILSICKSPSGLFLHPSSRHGSFDAFGSEATLDSAFSILLLFVRGILLLHVWNMGRPVRTVTNRHTNANLVVVRSMRNNIDVENLQEFLEQYSNCQRDRHHISSDQARKGEVECFLRT